jgi:beta-galactosidase
LADRTIEVKNWHDFTNLKDFAAGVWRVTADGKQIQCGKLPELDLAPGAAKQLTIPVKAFVPPPGAECFLELDFTLNHRMPWAKAGHPIAWDQFKLPDAAPAQDRSAGSESGAPFKLTQDEAKGFELAFDKQAGTLKSWRYHGVELIETPLRPDFWRAPTDNDRGRKVVDSQGIWRDAHRDSQLRSLAVQEDPQSGTVVVKVAHALPKVDVAWETDYTIHADGEVTVAARFKPAKTNLPKLPRLGMQMTLPAGFERITWLGPGPQETYWDRKDAKFGLYSGTVEEQFYAGYTKPGESGNKTDTRWVALRNGKGVGLLAIGLPLLSANALHYTTDDLQGPRHAPDLTHRDFVVLNVDFRQQGLGGDDSWGAWPHDAFLIPCREYSYQFRLRPLAGGDRPEALARAAAQLPK